MKYRSLILSICLLNAFLLTAQQKIFVDVEANVLLMQKSSFEQTREFTYWIDESINDSTTLRSTYHQESTNIYNYNPELSYEIGGNVNFKLTKKFRLRTGLGLNLMKFNITRDFGPSSVTLLSTDTIMNPLMPTGTLGGVTCTSFANNFTDFGVIDDAEYYDIVALRIPIGLSYSFLHSKINIAIGGFMQTPIFNRYRTERLLLNRTQDPLNEGQTVCTYERQLEVNNLGEGIRSLNFGYNFSVSYQIEKNLDVQFALLKDVTNTFHDDSDSAISFVNHELFPTRLALGLRYSFTNNRE